MYENNKQVINKYTKFKGNPFYNYKNLIIILLYDCDWNFHGWLGTFTIKFNTIFNYFKEVVSELFKKPEAPWALCP